MIVEILVKVSFLKHILTKSDAGVVEGDYNSTKLVFDFEEDVSNKRIVFKMSNPAGELIFLKDLEDNAVVLVGKDENGNTCSLFPTYGLYPFELVLYSEDKKLTSAPGWINVTKSHVTIEDSTVSNYLPWFDKIANLHSTFIRYSEYPDGTDFTDTWTEGQNYMGVATAPSAPVDKSGYTWVRVSKKLYRHNILFGIGYNGEIEGRVDVYNASPEPLTEEDFDKIFPPDTCTPIINGCRYIHKYDSQYTLIAVSRYTDQEMGNTDFFDLIAPLEFDQYDGWYGVFGDYCETSIARNNFSIYEESIIEVV